MTNRITYAVDHQDGVVVSRVGDHLAWPVLDYKSIGAGGADKHANTGEESGSYAPQNFSGPLRYNLEKFPLFDIPGGYAGLQWTRKIPLEIKNYHRAFWGMKALKRRTEI